MHVNLSKVNPCQRIFCYYVCLRKLLALAYNFIADEICKLYKEHNASISLFNIISRYLTFENTNYFDYYPGTSKEIYLKWQTSFNFLISPHYRMYIYIYASLIQKVENFPCPIMRKRPAVQSRSMMGGLRIYERNLIWMGRYFL